MVLQEINEEVAQASTGPENSRLLGVVWIVPGCHHLQIQNGSLFRRGSCLQSRQTVSSLICCCVGISPGESTHQNLLIHRLPPSQGYQSTTTQQLVSHPAEPAYFKPKTNESKHGLAPTEKPAECDLLNVRFIGL